MEIKNIPTQKQASIMLGNIASELLAHYNHKKYDYSPYIIVDAHEILWTETFNKLKNHFSVLSSETIEQIGAINQFALNIGENKPFNQEMFLFGLMDGKSDWINN